MYYAASRRLRVPDATCVSFRHGIRRRDLLHDEFHRAAVVRGAALQESAHVSRAYLRWVRDFARVALRSLRAWRHRLPSPTLSRKREGKPCAISIDALRADRFLANAAVGSLLCRRSLIASDVDNAENPIAQAGFKFRRTRRVALPVDIPLKGRAEAASKQKERGRPPGSRSWSSPRVSHFDAVTHLPVGGRRSMRGRCSGGLRGNPESVTEIAR